MHQTLPRLTADEYVQGVQVLVLLLLYFRTLYLQRKNHEYKNKLKQLIRLLDKREKPDKTVRPSQGK